jgi:hypothetical protein
MSVFVSNSVVLTYDTSISQTFNALFAGDDNFDIISLPKQRIDWMLIENIIGYRNVYNVRFNLVTTAQKNFLYNFIQSGSQQVTINGSIHNVKLRDSELALELIDGYIGNIGLELEFEDDEITEPHSVYRLWEGYTSSSAGYDGSNNLTGTIAILSYAYSATELSHKTKRRFRINSVYSCRSDILDKRWEYLDKNNGVRKLGYRRNVEIDFGCFGLGHTPNTIQDDMDFIKDFILAPSKQIEVLGEYVTDVVNDFSEVRYSYLNNNIYGKTLRLNFKQKQLQTNLPLESAGRFIFGSTPLGTKQI